MVRSVERGNVLPCDWPDGAPADLPLNLNVTWTQWVDTFRRGPFVCPVRPIRKARGHTQSWFMQMDDGRELLLKAAQNPFGSISLAKSLLAGLMLARVSIDIPGLAIIHISEAFVSEFPLSYSRSGKETVLRAGYHFGSYVPSGTVFDFFPRALHGRLVNRDTFSRALVIDSWMRSASTPQAIFFKANRLGGFKALHIGRSQTLGGSLWKCNEAAAPPLYFDKAVYADPSSTGAIESTALQIEHMSDGDLLHAARAIPEEWLEGNRREFDSAVEQMAEWRSTIRTTSRQLCRELTVSSE